MFNYTVSHACIQKYLVYWETKMTKSKSQVVHPAADAGLSLSPQSL